MRLTSWNVNGIRAVAKKDFFNSLASLETDILCLQETKAQCDQVAETWRHSKATMCFLPQPSKKAIREPPS